MKAKIFIFPFVLAIVLGLFSCASGSDSSLDSKTDTTDPTSDSTDPTIYANVVIPDEHPITYSLLSQDDYTSAQFYNTYYNKFTSILSSLSSNINFRQILSKLIEKLTNSTSSSSKASTTELFEQSFHVVKLQYTTVDVDNTPIEASELLVWNDDNPITEVLYANHGTRLGEFDSPSNGLTPEVFFVTSGALVIIPDYIGAGITQSHSEPYLNAQNNGDVAVDGYLAGIKYAKENISCLSNDFSGYIVGYSQGGSVSLAALRSLQQRSDERQSMLNVKRVVCGDGPYDLAATFNNYLTQDEMMLPLVLPLAINGMLASYKEDAENVDYQSCFTTEAYATGVPTAIRDNTVTLASLVGFYSSGANASEVLSKSMMNETSNEYKILMSLLELQNLCTGWSPKYPLLFIHDKGDTVVPYVNMEHALEGLKNEYVMDPIILDEGSDHGGGMIYMFPKIMNGELYK